MRASRAPASFWIGARQLLPLLLPYAVTDTGTQMIMCQAPTRLSDNTLVACRGCPICRDNRINDLVGRCIAEQVTSDVTLSLTLTYAGDTPNSVILNYRDVQLMLKSLRKAGHKVRYIVAGEYGTAKGRAHWHIILFFKGSSPALPLERRINWPFWPHGFVYAQNPDYKGFRYVLKYTLKDQESEGTSKRLAMSKKPPLGHAFFMQLASDLVSRGLPLHSPEYSFSHVINSKGVPRKYWLQGRMREMLLERYVDLWQQTYGTNPPWTEFVTEQHHDKIARAEMANDFDLLARDIQARAPDPEKIRTQIFIEDADLNARSLGILLLPSETGVIVEAFSNGYATITNEVSEWSISANAIAVQLSQSAALPNSLKLPVSRWLIAKWQPLGLVP